MRDPLRIALLRNWRPLGFYWPVYGVVDVDELTHAGTATLAIGNRRWCEVTADDVRLVADLDIGELVTAYWADELP